MRLLHTFMGQPTCIQKRKANQHVIRSILDNKPIPRIESQVCVLRRESISRPQPAYCRFQYGRTAHWGKSMNDIINNPREHALICSLVHLECCMTSTSTEEMFLRLTTGSISRHLLARNRLEDSEQRRRKSACFSSSPLNRTANYGKDNLRKLFSQSKLRSKWTASLSIYFPQIFLNQTLGQKIGGPEGIFDESSNNVVALVTRQSNHRVEYVRHSTKITVQGIREICFRSQGEVPQILIFNICYPSWYPQFKPRLRRFRKSTTRLRRSLLVAPK